jgi:hypothetical protein
MQGAPRRSARSFFLLPLVLALLALVALPGFASAAGGEVPEYKVPATPTFKVRNKTEPKHKVSPTESSTDLKAEGSAAREPVGGESKPTETELEENDEKEQSRSGGAPGSEGGGSGGAGGDGSKSVHGDGGQSKDGLGEAREVETGGGTATPVAHKTESSGGGSSPVVPILIAVIALAAISIGVALYRERRQGGTPTATGAQR